MLAAGCGCTIHLRSWPCLISAAAGAQTFLRSVVQNYRLASILEGYGFNFWVNEVLFALFIMVFDTALART
jgi:hypothetical protein